MSARGGEAGAFVALASIVLASYIGLATNSPTVLVTLAAVVLLAVLYLVRQGLSLRRERARRAKDRQRRREALGVPSASEHDRG